MAKPDHPHSCISCIFKGSFSINGIIWDVYHCCDGACLLFRWGDKAPDYLCAPIETFPQKGQVSLDKDCKVINRAFMIAGQMALLPKNRNK